MTETTAFARWWFDMPRLPHPMKPPTAVGGPPRTPSTRSRETMRAFLSAAVLLAPLASVSCSSTPQVEFRVSVISTEEKEIPAVILLDNRVQEDPATRKPLIAPATIVVTFPPRKSGSGFEDVRLSVRAVAAEKDGTLRGLQPGDSPYLEDKNSWRYLQPGDSRDQLFILRKNRVFKPGS
jgi:hypothetical protein